MDGTDKQVAWAEQIRTATVTALREYVAANAPADKRAAADSEVDRILAAVDAGEGNRASWWIDSRNDAGIVPLPILAQYARRAGVK